MAGIHRHHRDHQPIHRGHFPNPLDEKLFRIIRENLTDQESQLTEEERWRLEHLRLHEKHRGHEEMHAEMVLILMFVTIIAQVGLVAWKKKHYKSYQTGGSSTTSVGEATSLANRHKGVSSPFSGNQVWEN